MGSGLSLEAASENTRGLELARFLCPLLADHF